MDNNIRKLPPSKIVSVFIHTNTFNSYLIMVLTLGLGL
ncbi:hypothetical protein RINTHM_7420 [Richelia intracellularis HM01]|nr:hypothetical protein RINTHM_7420 [Richelia intracellularis HM01]